MAHMKEAKDIFLAQAKVNDEANTDVDDLVGKLWRGQLSNKELGILFGEETFRGDVVAAFMHKIDIKENMTLVQTIRLVMERIPFQIFDTYMTDRFMTVLGAEYAKSHPEADASSWYMLAMAIVLLNGDLHAKESTSRKMTLEEFKSNILRLESHGLKGEILTEAYKEVEAKEIVSRKQNADLDNDALDYSLCASMPRKEMDNAHNVMMLKEELGSCIVQGPVLIADEAKSTSCCANCCTRQRFEALHARLYGARLLMYKKRKRSRKSSAPEFDPKLDIAKVILVRHMMATLVEGSSQNKVFCLSHPDLRAWTIQIVEGDASEWVSKINLQAARTSGLPLPTPIGSSQKWIMPTLPISKHDATDVEKFYQHSESLKELQKQDLTEASQIQVRYHEHETRKFQCYLNALENLHKNETKSRNSRIHSWPEPTDLEILEDRDDGDKDILKEDQTTPRESTTSNQDNQDKTTPRVSTTSNRIVTTAGGSETDRILGYTIEKFTWV
eukprot:m.144295 g.144295  ORF g.144295 m.144295 type:complete len:501 (+) comp14914_c0_seq5:192-1694(+)